MRRQFLKMHGAGNDYIYFDCLREPIADMGGVARRLSDRHKGIGGDGAVFICPSEVADARMRMFNADGSEGNMCGNAIRCVGKFVFDNGLCTKDTIQVETAAGIRIVRLLKDGGIVTGATVDMGAPILVPADIPATLPDGVDKTQFVDCPVTVDGTVYRVTAVSMGNPHAVIFLQGIDDLDLPAIGPKFEHHPLFPQRTNTEFVKVLSSSRVRMRVWERGTGETLACGTGACAVAVACVLNEQTGRTVDVELRGGVLHIVWDKADNHVYMSGPAVTVFDGELPA